MKNFIASVSDDYADRIDDVAERLRNRGFVINRVMRLTGVISGRVKNSVALNELKIDGIESVEIQKKVRKV